MQEIKNKYSLFFTELEYIDDNQLRDVATKLLNILPDYFFTIPASSTGKYHPQYALGDGGLLRHTKAAVKIANELFRMEQYQEMFTKRQKDLMIIALFCHDGFKDGLQQEDHTRFDHPLIAAEKIAEEANKYLAEEDVKFICQCIKSHMGQWNTNSFYIGVELPKPKETWEKFVHLADYLASRKFLELTF